MMMARKVSQCSQDGLLIPVLPRVLEPSSFEGGGPAAEKGSHGHRAGPAWVLPRPFGLSFRCLPSVGAWRSAGLASPAAYSRYDLGLIPLRALPSPHGARGTAV